MTINNDFPQIIIDYAQQKPISRIYVFGSTARNQTDSNSDIDLLVELEKGVSLFEFIRFQLDLEALLQKKVDLISTNGLSPLIKPFVDKDKILIYEKH